MGYKLIVRHPFKKFVKGQVITDPTEVARLSGSHEKFVIRVALSAEEEAEAEAARKAKDVVVKDKAPEPPPLDDSAAPMKRGG
jgi:hypothetical protein